MSNVTTDREQAIRELLDREAVREVIMRYCRGIDRGDAAMINSAYHPDAFDDHCGMEFTGETVGPGLVAHMRATTAMSMHHITTQTIEIRGDDAASESYYTAVYFEIRDGVQRKMQTFGRYVDRLERRAGEWRIVHRLVVLETADYLPQAENPLSAIPRLARRDEDDPSYAALAG